jgi:hypothetical protein
VSRAFLSWKRPILTEIYLCHAGSYHENAPGLQRGCLGAATSRWTAWERVSCAAVLVITLGDDCQCAATRGGRPPQKLTLVARVGRGYRRVQRLPRPVRGAEAALAGFRPRRPAAGGAAGGALWAARARERPQAGRAALGRQPLPGRGACPAAAASPVALSLRLGFPYASMRSRRLFLLRN